MRSAWVPTKGWPNTSLEPSRDSGLPVRTTQGWFIAPPRSYSRRGGLSETYKDRVRRTRPIAGLTDDVAEHVIPGLGCIPINNGNTPCVCSFCRSVSIPIQAHIRPVGLFREQQDTREPRPEAQWPKIQTTTCTRTYQKYLAHPSRPRQHTQMAKCPSATHPCPRLPIRRNNKPMTGRQARRCRSPGGNDGDGWFSSEL